MSKDKEFKAKNRDLNFSKPQKDDTVLGRQNRPEEQKTDLSSSKKNRMYQQRQEAHEQPADVSETKTDISQNSVSDTEINNAENPVYVNNSQVSRHKKAQFFRGSGYFVCSQYKASASLGVSILSVPCGLFVL